MVIQNYSPEEKHYEIERGFRNACALFKLPGSHAAASAASNGAAVRAVRLKALQVTGVRRGAAGASTCSLCAPGTYGGSSGAFVFNFESRARTHVRVKGECVERGMQSKGDDAAGLAPYTPRSQNLLSHLLYRTLLVHS